MRGKVEVDKIRCDRFMTDKNYSMSSCPKLSGLPAMQLFNTNEGGLLHTLANACHFGLALLGCTSAPSASAASASHELAP